MNTMLIRRAAFGALTLLAAFAAVIQASGTLVAAQADDGYVFDSDGDGLEDGEEIGWRGSDPYNPDSDGDGLTDYDEIHLYHTDPLIPEVAVEVGPTPRIDSDWDGLADAEEAIYGTDPFRPDWDNDCLYDGDEVLLYGTSPFDRDSDGDGIADWYELWQRHSDPLTSDAVEGEQILAFGCVLMPQPEIYR